MTEPNQKELFDEVDEVNRRFETEALSQPSLVDFFLPTLWPLGFTGEQRLTLPRIEQIPWGNDVEWEDWRLAMKVTAGANFVTIRIHRHEHSAVFDPRLGQYAMELNQQSAVSSPKSESNKEASEETQMISTSPVSFGDIPIPSVNNRATIVQLTTALFETENRSGDLLQWAFCNCLEELNLLEAAYLLATNDLKVRLTTLHNCFPFVPFTAHAQSDSRIISRGSVIPNLMSKHFDYEVEDLTESQFERVLVFSSMLRRKNAMAEYGLRSIAARQTVEQDGNLTASFLEFYTATEMFLDSVLLMMAWEHIEHHRHSKLTVNQVVQWFSGRTSLRSRITNYYRRLNLKGWNPSVQGSALNVWINDVTAMRNKIVHAGYNPTYEEVETIRYQSDKVEEFTKEILLRNENRNRYPRTVLNVVTIEGMERREMLNGFFRKLIAEEHMQWEIDFGQFQRRVANLMAGTPA